MLEEYIEQLKSDGDVVRQGAARVLKHVYAELCAANRIKG
jgi:hypothetical protein